MPGRRENLGALAERESRIVPIAFHVDYFNDPWKDVFSDPLYSQRQMVYNQLYTKPKNPEYGLYYTPMLMIDGRQSVNGRDAAVGRSGDPSGLGEETSRGARRRSSKSSSDGRSGTATIKVTSRSTAAEKSPLLVCAVLREDGVVTDVPSGENAGKSLVARFPARQTKYEFIELDGKSPTTQAFHLQDRAGLEPSEPPAGRVRSGQTHRRHSPGDGSSLARDPNRRDLDDHRDRKDAQGTLKGALMLSRIQSMALAAAVVLLVAPTAFSQGKGKPASDEQSGLKAGEKAPKFTLKDQEGKEHSLDDLLKKGKVALVFYRSADW